MAMKACLMKQSSQAVSSISFVVSLKSNESVCFPAHRLLSHYFQPSAAAKEANSSRQTLPGSQKTRVSDLHPSAVRPFGPESL